MRWAPCVLEVELAVVVTPPQSRHAHFGESVQGPLRLQRPRVPDEDYEHKTTSPESSVDDLGTCRGVVLSRAALYCDLLRLSLRLEGSFRKEHPPEFQSLFLRTLLPTSCVLRPLKISQVPTCEPGAHQTAG